ncbi:MAG: sensor histidine kinase [Actinomycetota bacterium]
MSTTSGPSERRSWGIIAFQLLVIVPTLALGSALLWDSASDFTAVLLLWSVLIALVELLPVPVWRGLQVSVGFPLLIMIAILYPPGIAGLLAFLGASDPREFTREVSVLRALFNRSQVALSVIAASFVFHSIAEIGSSPPWTLLLAAAVAAIADYVVNSTLVTIFVSMRVRAPISQVAKELRVGKLSDFLLTYLGLGLLGLTLAVFYDEVGPWSLPAYLAPLLLARAMFFRSQALEEAHKELQDREQVLRTLSNAMAEERSDERLQIAGYLHDDLAQVLFRLSIQVDVARKLMDKGELAQVTEQLDKIRESKQETSDRIRALIRDLHRSPLGAKGLAEALESFTDEVGRDSGVRFHRDVEDIDLPAPIALLVYHIAREGVMNSLKHAKATDMWIAVREQDESIVLELRDNGVGFDTTAPGPEGHFGMAMMSERAQVGGGTFEVESAPDEGATITVRFPISLLQSETPQAGPGSDGAGGAQAIGASPDIPGGTEQEDDGSRRSVPA